MSRRAADQNPAVARTGVAEAEDSNIPGFVSEEFGFEGGNLGYGDIERIEQILAEHLLQDGSRREDMTVVTQQPRPIAMPEIDDSCHQENPSPFELLRTAHARGAVQTIDTLVKLSEKQAKLPFYHLCGLIEWPCEQGTDKRVVASNRLLRRVMTEAMHDGDFFSVLCQQYKFAQSRVEAEKEVVWCGEIKGIAFVVAGGLVLGLVPGAAKAAGAAVIFVGGVCAGVAEAHQGNAIRVHNIGLNLESAISLLAGDDFLRDLNRVESNEEFRNLFSRNNIPCKEGLKITPEYGHVTQAARTIVGNTSGDQLAGGSNTRSR
jgi:hypothetical protein